MSRIFISYRREDTGMGVGRLADSLREHFAREQVFQDISSIDPGADFIEVLQKALSDCAAVLVVIGPRWLTVTGRQGKRRLDDPHDWVRQEIVEALGRTGLKVFPLLVDGAEMPSAEDLPEPLQPLARRQAYELTLRHWAKDVDVLATMLKRIPALAGTTASPVAAQPSAPAGRLDDELREQRGREAEQARSEADEARQRAEAEAARMAEAQRQARAEEERQRAEAEAKRRAEEERQRQEAEAVRKAQEARQRAEAVARPASPETGSAGAQGARTGAASLPWKPLAAGATVMVALVVMFASAPDKKPASKPEAAERPAVPQGLTEPPGATFRDCDECPEMVVVPEGDFIMGSPPDEKGRSDDEGPQHPVKLASFALGRTAVTVGEFKQFVAASGYKTEAERNPDQGILTYKGGSWDWTKGASWRAPGFSQMEKHPVVGVSWNDAQAYVKWIWEKSGKAYRLPSEAEREYATRAKTTTSRFWGDDSAQACHYGNVGDKAAKWQRHDCDDRYVYTAPVGSFKPNAFKLYDMIGNVGEWTQDCWNDNYKGASGDGKAWESGDCGQRVVRGGTWVSGPDDVRSAFRSRSEQGLRSYIHGFRLARTL